MSTGELDLDEFGAGLHFTFEDDTLTEEAVTYFLAWFELLLLRFGGLRWL